MPTSGSVEVLFVDLAGVEIGADVDSNGFWAIPLSLNNSNRYYIKLRVTDESVITDYFVDANSNKIELADRTPFIFNRDIGRFVPDVTMLQISEDSESLGLFNLQEFEETLSTLSGRIIDDGDLDFKFEAVNIATSETILFSKSDYLINQFGFKIPKDGNYSLSLYIYRDGVISENYIIGYRDINSTKLELFSESELDFNSSDIPLFDKYIEPLNDIEFELDLKSYRQSIYSVSGVVKADEGDYYVTAIDSQNGQLLSEVSLKEYNSVTKTYSYSLSLGRDLADREVSIYLTDSSNSDLHYLYTPVSPNIRVVNDSKFLEKESGFVPDSSIYQPLTLGSKTTTINFDLTSLESYSINLSIILPQSLQLGFVCEDNLSNISYGECNSSQTSLGFNYISVEFIDSDSNSSSVVKMMTSEMIFKSDIEAHITPLLHLYQFNETTRKTEHSRFILTDLTDSQLTPYSSSIAYPELALNSSNMIHSISMDLEGAVNRRFSLAGSISGQFERIQITAIDGDSGNIIGTMETNLTNYSLSLNKFIDSNSSNNDIIFEIMVDRERLFYFNGSSIRPLEEIEFLDQNGSWIVDKESSGYITLSDTSRVKTVNLDLTALFSALENSTNTISGTVTSLQPNSRVRIELVDIESKTLSASKEYLSGSDGNITFSLSTLKSGNHTLYIHTAEESYFYMPYQTLPIKLIQNISLIPLTFGQNYIIELNKEIDSPTLSLEVANRDYLGSARVVAYSINGEWLGDGEIGNDGNLSIKLSTSSAGDEIILKILGDSKSYYLGSNNILVESRDIALDSSGFILPSTLTPITVKAETSKKFDLEELVDFIETTQYRLYGTLQTDRELELQLIDLSTGRYLQKSRFNSGDYSLSSISSGDFALFISDGERKMFYDFNRSRPILADSVEFENINGVWVPKRSGDNNIALNSTSRQQNIDIDLLQLETYIPQLSGNITLPSDFPLGVSGDDNSTWRGAYISVIDSISSNEILFREIESNGISTTSGLKYPLVALFENLDGSDRDLIFKFYIYEIVDGVYKSREILYDYNTQQIYNGKFATISSVTPFSTSRSELNMEFNLLGINSSTDEKVLTVEVTTPQSFSLEQSGNSGFIYLYSTDGSYIDSVEIESDGNVSIPVGSGGEYILSLEIIHRDLLYKEKSFRREMFYDSSSEKLISSDEVKFKESSGEYVPDVSGVIVDKNITISLVVDEKDSFYFSGLLNSTGVEWKSLTLSLKDYKANRQYVSLISNNKFYFGDILEGNYTVRLFGEDNLTRKHSLFLTDSGNSRAEDISWSFENDHYYPNGAKVVEIKSDMASQTLNFGTVSLAQQRQSIDIRVDSDGVEWVELFIPNSSINIQTSCNSDECVIQNGTTALALEGVLPKDGYYLQIRSDGKDYFYNSDSEELESGVEWDAYSGVTKVCSTDQKSWECDWSSSSGWSWRPRVGSIDLSDLTADIELELTMPNESSVSGDVLLGDLFGNREFNIALYQLNDSTYEIFKVRSGSGGELNISAMMKPADGYRVELFNHQSHFVLSYQTGVYKLLQNSDSWIVSESGSEPLDSTLLDFTSDLEFGQVSLPDMNNLNINIANMESDEEIFIKLYGEDSSFRGETDSNSTTIAVEDGVYKVVIYPSKHSSGYLVGDDSSDIFDKFEWNRSSAVDLTIYNDREISLLLPSNSDLRSISGEVSLGDGDIESGWIEATSTFNSRGAVVADDGSYLIEGLKPSLDYNYTLQYTSWNFENRSITKDIGVWGSGDMENFDLTEDSTLYIYAGKISYNGDDEPELRALLIQRDKSSGDWRVVAKEKLDSDGNYSFENLQILKSREYFVAVGSRVKDTDGVKYIKFNATDGDRNSTILEWNSSIEISVVQSAVTR